ncbi:MAG: 23S rRNA (adenine(1618)-N(6))-methyltransferase RlmF [Pseudomonas sp.]
MSAKTNLPGHKKAPLHPRNRHQGHYDLAALAAACPALKPHIIRDTEGSATLDFSQPQAVTALNQALLLQQYGIRDWGIPDGYLCPPVPGRADYLHALADLLGESHDGKIPTGEQLVGLDTGTGANLIYPLLGRVEYQWRFVGSDIDAVALSNAARLLTANPALASGIQLRQQNQAEHLFSGIVAAQEQFDFTLCNPPFHSSQAAASAGSQRKWRNLGRQSATGETLLNFGGQRNELMCEGGEAGFVSRMIEESSAIAQQVFWFTCLISRAENLPALKAQLQALGARDVRIIPMAQGQKRSRLLAWTFLNKKQRRAWRKARWPS